ncbi:ABC transporter [Nakaseomyces glabratus]|nr:ABC transporter [Nakaseomyces glabratus]
MLSIFKRYHKGNIYMNIRFRKNIWLLILILVCTVINGLVPAISSILFGRIFHLLDDNSDKVDYNTKRKQLVIRTMSILILGMGNLPFNWLAIYGWMMLGERQSYIIRKKLFHEYFNLPCSWFDKYRSDIMGEFTQLHRCIEEVRSSSAEASAIMSQSLVAVIALIGTAFYFSWSLTLIIFCSTPFIIICAVIFSKYIHKYTEKENTESECAAERLAWMLKNIEFVRLHNGDDFEISMYTHSIAQANEYYIKASLFISANISILRLLSLLMFVQGFWFGSSMIKQGKLNIDSVITSFHCCLMLGSIINSALGQAVVLQKGDVAMKRLLKMIDRTPRESLAFIDAISGIDLLPIVFNNVSFCYPERKTDKVFDEMNFIIKPNKMTYVIGPSGSGKSTLFDLILLHYDNYHGSIMLGDLDIRSINRNIILENITLVSQTPTLFNDTIRNNILACSNWTNLPSKLEMECICKFALLENLIAELPDGLDTRIGSGGIKLSGGQAQKVALARAFARNTSILLLDEPLSAVDMRQRIVLMENIKRWRNGKTTVIITHDLEFIRSTDNILNISERKILSSALNTEKTQEFKWDDHLTSESIYDNSATVSTDVSYLEEEAFQGEEYQYLAFSAGLSEYDQKDLESNTKSVILIPFNEIIYKFIISSSKKHVLVIGLIAAIIAAICNPVFSFTFSYLMNGLLPTSYNSPGSGYLLKFSLIVSLIALCDGVSTFIKLFFLGYSGEFWIFELRQETFIKIIKNPISWFSKSNNKAPILSTLLINDLRDLRNLVTEFLSVITTLILVTSIGLVWAIAIGWKLSLVCIAIIPLVVVLTGLYGTILIKTENRYKTSVANLESIVYEAIIGMKTIQSLCLQQYITKKFNCKIKLLEKNGTYRAVATGLGIALTNMLVLLFQSILFYYGFKLVLTGEYTHSKLFETIALLLFTIVTVASLVTQLPDITRGQRSISWIDQILKGDNQQTIEPPSNLSTTKGIWNPNQPVIEVSNLSFTYAQVHNKKTLTNINMQLYSNQIYGIVGKSGSGKSTLINLICGLYSLSEGSITICSCDINKWSTKELHKTVALLQQNPVLQFDTIRNNLLYGLTETVGDEYLLNVLEYVGLKSFIISLNDGLDSKLDDSLLSGGQSQRLCMAREMLRNPKVLILDECTSALDVTSAKKINDIIGSRSLAPVTIIVSHQKETIKLCDKIFFLVDGTVAMMGTYEELMENNWEFRKLLNL